MGTRYRSWIATTAALAVLASAHSVAADAWDASRATQVVIISIDGLRADALSAERTPNIFALAKRGSYTLNAQTSTIPQTLPNHASMLSGVTPAVHKMTWDDYQAAQPNIAVPTVMSAVGSVGLQAVMVVGKKKLQHLASSSTVFVLTDRGDQGVAREAIVRLGLPFDLLFVHFPDVDLRGHAKDWMSAEYLTQVNQTDAAVGQVLAAVPPTAVVIFTTDHGGGGMSISRDHAAICRENMAIPWLIAGPGIRVGYAIQTPVNTVDTAATAAAILRVPMPTTITGRPIVETFVPIPSVVSSDQPGY